MSGGFSTEGLLAERLSLAHEEELAALHADELVMATLGGVVATAEESSEWIAHNVDHWREHGFGMFVFRHRETGAFAGRGGIRRVEIGGREEVEVAYAVAAEQWGRGLATEMATGLLELAERLGIGDVVAFTLPTNVASRRVMEKVGFVYEGEVEHHGLPHVLYRRRSAP